MRLVLVGTSHHHAPIELRERVSLDHEHATALAERLGEAVCLSTCNRTELYVVIIALKLQRLEREVDALARAAARERDEDQDREPVQVG